MAILSDAQEVLERGHPACDADARQLINRAKHFLIQERDSHRATVRPTATR